MKHNKLRKTVWYEAIDKSGRKEEEGKREREREQRTRLDPVSWGSFDPPTIIKLYLRGFTVAVRYGVSQGDDGKATIMRAYIDQTRGLSI